jgi:ribosomal protein S18 acetylase RimI-like enzyme
VPQTITYRPIEPDDCTAVAQLHLSTFGARDIAASIFLSPQVGHYLAQLVAFPTLQRENWLWGAWHESTLVAYVFGRALPAAWHLNYLAVAPAHQNRGIGQGLWNRWYQSGHDRNYRVFTVDVEQDNKRARTWYERKGYGLAGATWFYIEDLAAAKKPGSKLQLLNWENAEAWQKQFGFSQFNICSEKKTWTVGRLGENYFRAAYPLPKAAQGVLHHVDPTRRLLLMSPRRVSRLNELKVSFRLRSEI